jgi:phage-related protein
MAAFPQLKTGAVAQYPITRYGQYRNQTIRFIDGTEQRFREGVKAKQSWVIELNGLDESEIAAIEEFFLSTQGSYGSFAFTDPWDGKVYEDCSLDLAELGTTTIAEMRGLTRIKVVRNQ